MHAYYTENIYSYAYFSVPHCFHTHKKTESKCFMLKHRHLIQQGRKKRKKKNHTKLKLPSYGENYQVKD